MFTKRMYPIQTSLQKQGVLMTVSIKLPKEFEEHFNTDRFKDSLERIRVDIECSRLSYPTVSGLYEIELIKMLRTAFGISKVIKE